MAEAVMLLSIPASPFVMSVKIALAEKGVAYECHEEKFPNMSEMLLKLNPLTKQVPVLIHEGKPVFESLVVLEYVEEAWKGQGKSLLPPMDEPLRRAEARFWARYGNAKFWESALNMMRKQGDEAAKAKEDTIACYYTLEKEWSKLSYGRPFFSGDKLGLPDVVLAPLVSWKKALEALGGFEFPDASQCPRMAEWMEAIEEHPSVKPSFVDPDYVRSSALGHKKMIDAMSKKA